MNRYGKNSTVKTVALVVAFILLLAALGYLVGRCITGSWDIRTWAEKKPARTETETDSSAETPIEKSVMRLSAAKAADGSQTLTATVKDAVGATPDVLQDVTWSLWWDSDQDPAAYVEMTVNGCTATFKKKQDFNKQITVRCMSNISNSVRATATIDCAGYMDTWFSGSPDCLSPIYVDEGFHQIQCGALTCDSEISLFSGVQFKNNDCTLANKVTGGKISITPDEFFVEAITSSVGSLYELIFTDYDWLITSQHDDPDTPDRSGSSDPITAGEFFGKCVGIPHDSSAIGPYVDQYVNEVIGAGKALFHVQIDINFLYGASYHYEYDLKFVYIPEAASLVLDSPSLVL